MLKRNVKQTTALMISMTLVVLSAAECHAEASEHPLDPVIRIVSKCLTKIEQIPAYEATFTKNELVGNRMIAQKMRIKFRRRPFSVYFYFYGDNEGREVIYVEGENNGKLLAHETGLAGLVGTLELAPTDTMAMNENRHPITEAGIEKLLSNTLEQLREGTKYAESDVKYYKNAKLAKMTCNVVEISHPRPRRQFPYHMMRLWIDRESGIAVRLQQFAFPAREGTKPPVVEDYAFTDIRTNVEFTDLDFAADNPAYNF